jgi:hypothetical protein
MRVFWRLAYGIGMFLASTLTWSLTIFADEASAGGAVIDAAKRYFGASGYSMTAIPQSETTARGIAASFCKSLARSRTNCADVDGAQYLFTGGDVTFVMAQRKDNWVLVGMKQGIIVPGLEIGASEILCASYLADELVKRNMEAKVVEELVRPVARIGSQISELPRDANLSGMETTSGYITFFSVDRSVNCHLFKKDGGPPIVSADTRQRKDSADTRKKKDIDVK